MSGDTIIVEKQVYFNQMHERLMSLCRHRVDLLVKKNEEYGESWKQRGGVGAFMMLARKWDRLENQCRAKGYDIFAVILERAEQGKLTEETLNDLGDLLGYLLLVEDEVRQRLGNHPHSTDKAERVVADDFGKTVTTEDPAIPCSRCGIPGGPEGSLVLDIDPRNGSSRAFFHRGCLELLRRLNSESAKTVRGLRFLRCGYCSEGFGQAVIVQAWRGDLYHADCLTKFMEGR